MINRLAATEDANARASYYGYDKAGNLARELDARARATYYGYDAVGRQLRIRYEDATAHYYAYDAVGNLLRAEAPHGTGYFAYDEVNRQVRDLEPLVGAAYFGYDTAGNRTRIMYPSGGTAYYGYDEVNRMVRLASPDAKAAYYAYDASGLELRRLLGNDSATYFAYDDAGRLAYRRNAASDGTPFSYFDYGRLAGGNVARILREAGHAIYYTYDDADRLTHETWRAADHSGIYAFAYDYDAAGNRVKEDKDGQPVYFWYDEANELTLKELQDTGWTYFAYDENGSMLREYDQAADTTTYYEYADNGLASAIKPPAEDATYFHYDARMQRFAIDWAGTLSYFMWDGMNQLVEKDDSLATVAEHTHGQTPIESIGSVIVTKRSSEYQYPHYDHRGSLFNLEDTGATNLEAEFNAFGEELRRTGSAVTRFGYQGTSYMRLPIGSEIAGLSDTRILKSDEGRFGHVDMLAAFTIHHNTPQGGLLARWAGRLLRADYHGEYCRGRQRPIHWRLLLHEDPVVAFTSPMRLTLPEVREHLKRALAAGIGPSLAWADLVSSHWFVSGLRHGQPRDRRYLTCNERPSGPGTVLPDSPYGYVRNSPVQQVDPLGLRVMNAAETTLYNAACAKLGVAPPLIWLVDVKKAKTLKQALGRHVKGAAGIHVSVKAFATLATLIHVLVHESAHAAGYRAEQDAYRFGNCALHAITRHVLWPDYGFARYMTSLPGWGVSPCPGPGAGPCCVTPGGAGGGVAATYLAYKAVVK